MAPVSNRFAKYIIQPDTAGGGSAPAPKANRFAKYKAGEAPTPRGPNAPFMAERDNAPAIAAMMRPGFGGPAPETGRRSGPAPAPDGYAKIMTPGGTGYKRLSPMPMPDQLAEIEADKAREAARAKARRESAAAFGGGMDMMPTEDEGGNVRPGTAVDADLSKGIVGAPLQALEAVKDAGVSMANLAGETYNAANKAITAPLGVKPWQAPKITTPDNPLIGEGGALQSISGDLERNLMQFLISRKIVGNVAPGGGTAANLGKDALALGAGFDADTGRLSETVNEFVQQSGSPQIAKDYIGWLAQRDPNNPLLERFKNMVEDLTISGPLVAPQAAVRGGQAIGNALAPVARTPTNAGGTAARAAVADPYLVREASPTPAPGAAGAAPAAPQKSMFSSTGQYSVSTQDSGAFDVNLNRMNDGGAVIMHDKGTIPIAPEFAKGKSDEELLAYYFEPLGFQGATKAASAVQPPITAFPVTSPRPPTTRSQAAGAGAPPPPAQPPAVVAQPGAGAPPPGTLTPVPTANAATAEFNALPRKVRESVFRAMRNSGFDNNGVIAAIRDLNTLPPDRQSMFATELVRKYGAQFPELEANLAAMGRKFAVDTPKPRQIFGRTIERDGARQLMNDEVRSQIDSEADYLNQTVERLFGPGAVPAKEELLRLQQAGGAEYRRLLSTTNRYGRARAPAKRAEIDRNIATLASYLKRPEVMNNVPDWVKQKVMLEVSNDLRQLKFTPDEQAIIVAGDPGLAALFTPDAPLTYSPQLWNTLVDLYPTQSAHSLQSAYAKAIREARFSSDPQTRVWVDTLSRARGKSTVRANARNADDRGFGLLKMLEDAVPGYKEARLKYGNVMGAQEALDDARQFMSIAGDETKLAQFIDDYEDLSDLQRTAVENQVSSIIRQSIANKVDNPKLAELGREGPSTPNLTAISKQPFLDALPKVFGARGQEMADAIRLARSNTDYLTGLHPKYNSRTGVNEADVKNADRIYEDPAGAESSIIDNAVTQGLGGAGLGAAFIPGAAGAALPLIGLAAAKALWTARKAGKRLSPSEKTQLAEFLFRSRRQAATGADGAAAPGGPPQLPGPRGPSPLDTGGNMAAGAAIGAAVGGAASGGDPNAMIAGAATGAGAGAVRAQARNAASLIKPTRAPNALASPPARPPVRAGFGGSSKPLDMSEAARIPKQGYESIRIGPATVEITRAGDQATINRLKVSEGERGKGAASRALDEVLRQADAEGVTLFLTPERIGDTGLSDAQLKAFYARHGFVSNRGPDRDFSTTATMVRKPRSSQSYRLDMSEAARMQRAREQGFDTSKVWYHGAQRMDRLVGRGSLDPKRATSGPMIFFTDDPTIASRYATGKADNSMAELENLAGAFTVSPKALGLARGRTPYTVEQSWHFLTPEQKRTIMDRVKRIGYEDFNTSSGPLTLHPEGTEATLSGSHFDYLMKTEARGNPLTALRQMWLEGGNLYGQEEQLKKIYQLAGYPHPISMENAPWTTAEGVMPAYIRMRKPLQTDNPAEVQNVIARLRQDFASDRTRKKAFGADDWDKNTRFTPREWVEQLASDVAKGENSYVWTSIPDKVTDALKRMGYDGIVDTGGKGGGPGHQVAIPFYAENVRGKFAAFDPSQSGSSKLLAGMGASPEGLGAAAGGAAGYVLNPTDANGDGVIDDADRGLNAMGGLISGGLGVKAVRSGGNALRNIVPPRPSGPAQATFGGVNAKTADLKLHRIAQDMEKAGAGRDQIWKETGWFKGNDGKWRFEIDDSGAKFDQPYAEPWSTFLSNAERNKYGRNFSPSSLPKKQFDQYLKWRDTVETDYNTKNATWRDLGDVMPHDRLYEAHPDLASVRVGRFDHHGKGGHHNPDQNVIEYGDSTNASGARSLMLHESQHAVQTREGFAKGGNPDAPDVRDIARKERDASRLTAKERYENLLTEVRAFQDDYIERYGMHTGSVSYKEAAGAWREQFPEKAFEMDNAFHLMNGAAPDYHGAYRRLAGETEARNVQARRDFTPEERRARPPWTTQDVPDDQQIVRYGAGKQESRPPKPSQAGFSFGGGKGPPGNALKVGRGVVEQVERAAKTVSPEVKNRLAANARLPYGQRKTAMEAAGDDPSLYRMAAPYQGAGRKKPTALDLGIEQGVKRAATLPKDVSLNPLLNAVEVTRKASSAAQRAETAAYKAGKIKEPGHPLVQTRIHAERAARDAKQKLLDASLEAIGREEAINQVNRRVSEIADELMKGPQAGPVARLPKPAPWHKNGRRGDLPKPKSRREADEMARLLFDEEYADILSKALDGTLPLKARTPAHYVLSLAAAGAGTAGIAAMAYDLKNRGEESMRKNGLLPAIEPPKDPRRQFNWEERSKDREVVRSIQIALNNIDPTYELAEDGLYYTNSRRNPSRTEQAVRFWQHENGFEATGEVTDEQMRMLYQMGEEARRNRNAARASGRPANALAPAQLQ